MKAESMRHQKRLLSTLVLLLGTFSASADDAETCTKESCPNDSSTGTPEKPKCRVFRASDFGPTSKSIFFGEARGRLGNQLLGYALIQHFRHVVGVDAYINAECKEYLTSVFTNDSVRVPVLEETFCNPREIPWTSYHGHIKDILTDETYRTGKFILLWPPLPGSSDGYKPENNHCDEQEAMQKSYVDFMRRTLRFKPKFERRVRKTMTDVAKKMGKKFKEVTFVGVHGRRTDSDEFVKRKWHDEQLGPEYFIDAMQYFRDEYENVAFLYVSDDMEWSRKHIKDEHGDLFFVSQGKSDDPDSIGFDLAIMAHSNHTVISRGTYSMWGSLLCGGEYYTEYGAIVPVHLQDS